MLQPIGLPTTSITPTPTETGVSTPTGIPLHFQPGTFYFDDTIFVITKDKPQINVIATVTRKQLSTAYIQNSRVGYFDGTDWVRKSDDRETPDSTIVGNPLVKRWDIEIDSSRVLKESVQGEILFDAHTLTFSTGTLHNEMIVRSLPGYTKVLSQGSGTLSVNGITRPAHVLYSRIYSLNAKDIQFYNQPLGVTTDWVAFWDTNGNFYHVDTTQVDRPTPIYQTHQLGIMEDTNGAVTKTFTITVSRDTEIPPLQFSVSLHNPISSILNLKRINGVNKAPNSSYIWYLGTIEGTVKASNGESIPGIGLFEYIHD